jgi:hypothetical protein
MRWKYCVEKDPDSGKPEWHLPIRDLHPLFTLQRVLLKLLELLKDEPFR